MKASFNTYESFLERKVKLGSASADGLDEISAQIVRSIDSSAGGAKIEFKRLCDEDFCRLTSGFDSPVQYGNESYIIEIRDTVTVYYTGEITKLYALYAIKRMYGADGINQGIVYNTPKLEFRCVRVYLPGREGIEDFLEFIDMLIAFGHNSIMIEIGGAMEYKRHPEISEGWREYCEISKEFNGKTEWIQRSSWYPKNSLHVDNGGWDYLTQEEIGRIVKHCKERHFEIIPEVPSLSHVDYLLYNHPEFSELQDDHLPNNACPQNEGYLALISDVLDEICDVFMPTRVNICHDEAYVFGYCPRCRGKDAGVLFANHITYLHDFLASRGVKTMIWCDGILPMHHGGNEAFHMRYPWDGERTVDIQGKKYEVHNFKCLTMEEYKAEYERCGGVEGLYVPPKSSSIDLIPKDIQAIDWSWRNYESEDILAEHGFYHVYGNFSAVGMPEFNERIKKGVSGISFSNWGANDFESLQRTNTLFAVGYNSLAVWGGEFDGYNITENTMTASDAVYRYRNYGALSKKHLKLIHNTTAVIDHSFFYDGFVIVREDYRIGDYEIEFTDGTKMLYPVYWGKNIGQAKVRWSSFDVSSVEDGSVTKYIYEPIGESKPILVGKESRYEIAIPIEKDVKSVKPLPREGYDINLFSFEVVGG